MTCKSTDPEDAQRPRLASHIRVTIDYQGRHYGARILQIETCRLTLCPSVPLSIPIDAPVAILSAALGRIEARIAAVGDGEIVVRLVESHAVIDSLVNRTGL